MVERSGRRPGRPAKSSRQACPAIASRKVVVDLQVLAFHEGLLRQEQPHLRPPSARARTRASSCTGVRAGTSGTVRRGSISDCRIRSRSRRLAPRAQKRESRQASDQRQERGAPRRDWRKGGSRLARGHGVAEAEVQGDDLRGIPKPDSGQQGGVAFHRREAPDGTDQVLVGLAAGPEDPPRGGNQKRGDGAVEGPGRRRSRAGRIPG
jgi:hypothetical protein